MNNNKIQNLTVIEPECDPPIPDRKFLLVVLRILLFLGVAAIISQFFVLNKIPASKYQKV